MLRARRLVAELVGGWISDELVSWLDVKVDVFEDFGRDSRDRARAVLWGYSPGEEPLHEHLRDRVLHGCVLKALPPEERPWNASGFFVPTDRYDVECYDTEAADEKLTEARQHTCPELRGLGLDRTRVELRVGSELLRAAGINRSADISPRLHALLDNFCGRSASKVYQFSPVGRRRPVPLDPRWERQVLYPLKQYGLRLLAHVYPPPQIAQRAGDRACARDE
jgi:hypothetical protein